jgi:serine/threonine protein kinase
MIGQTISHYRITGTLGSGGMGVVYKAEDTNLDRRVALKFLAAHLVESEEHKQRFPRGTKAAAAVDHPNICTIHEVGEADGSVFIAMVSSMGPR